MKKSNLEKATETALKQKINDARYFIFGVLPDTKIIANINPMNFWVWETNHYRPVDPDWLRGRVKTTNTNWSANKVDKYLRDLSYELYRGDRENQYRMPRGINCENGVLEVNPDDGEIRFREHNPDTDFFFEKPLVLYESDADTTEALRLLECVGNHQAEIILRTLAAVLDLPYLRSKRNRPVKAIFLHGGGNNGKDTLRCLTEMLFGKFKMASVSPEALAHAGQSQNYFGISGLHGASINWCSEIKVQKAVEENSFLKSLVTGDPIPYEKKYHDAIWYSPSCVNLFGTNHDIYNNSLNASFKSRFGLIVFEKTYSDRPNTELGELQADPRFRDDVEFCRTKVLSGLLRLIVERWEPLLAEGIDWSVSDENWDAHRSKMSHLHEFIEETGLHYDPEYAAKGFGLTVNEIWEELFSFYKREQIINSEGRIVAEDPRPGDKYLRHCNTIVKRFSPLFPHSTVSKRNITMIINNQQVRRHWRYFLGLRFSDPIVAVDRTPYLEDEARAKLCRKLIRVGSNFYCECEVEQYEDSWIKTHELRKTSDDEWVVEPLDKAIELIG